MQLLSVSYFISHSTLQYTLNYNNLFTLIHLNFLRTYPVLLFGRVRLIYKSIRFLNATVNINTLIIRIWHHIQIQITILIKFWRILRYQLLKAPYVKIYSIMKSQAEALGDSLGEDPTRDEVPYLHTVVYTQVWHALKKTYFVIILLGPYDCCQSQEI